ncbi:MAG TPA: transglutaminase-like domain-containing protein [Desulfitobacteriaceae bacterium]|nr:transglutaminase-like domain-containing protein [Desulfitobacteriaceae bacterium]
MELRLQSSNILEYLEQTKIVDYHHPLVIKAAKELSTNVSNEIELALIIYEYVRDKISHSADIEGKAVTCCASEVLKIKEGICYAKSHLLAALMRCNGIPCGFCYQLLRLENEESPLVIHGLNAIYLKSINKWIRLDSRGNKSGVNAQFLLEKEKLAFNIRDEFDEINYPIVFSKPDFNVIAALENSKSLDELWANLPSALYTKIL